MSDLRIESLNIAGLEHFTIYRLKDKKRADYEKNREYLTGFFGTKEKAEERKRELEEDIKKRSDKDGIF